MKTIAASLVRGLASLAMATSLSAQAAVTLVETGPSWLATDQAPSVGWNTDPAFDTGSWTPAFVTSPACNGTADCIWYDQVDSATQFAWMRRSFVVSDPMALLSAVLVGSVDDDAEIFVNGQQVFSDQSGMASDFGPIDLLPYLVAGTNFIAVSAADNFRDFGQNHAFVATVRLETASVPEPSPVHLLAAVGLGLAWVGRKHRNRGAG